MRSQSPAQYLATDSHSFVARDGYAECIKCGLHVEMASNGYVPYPSACINLECTVLSEQGFKQSHYLVAYIPHSSECNYCGCIYS